jgi:hypothetical protein
MYSLGIVAYELVSGGMRTFVLCVWIIISSFLLPGAHPFTGANGKVNMMKIMRGDHNDLSEREYSDGLKALICRMMDMVRK